MGEKIKAWREAHGLTIRQFAEMAGVSRQWVSFVESGSHENITVETLKKISKLTGITIDELIR